MHVSCSPTRGGKKPPPCKKTKQKPTCLLLNKRVWRKAPFLHQEPRLLIRALPLIPGLSLKSGRPGPLGCSPPLSVRSAAFTASEYPNLFHIPGGSPKGKVIILTQTVSPHFLSHSHPLGIENKWRMEFCSPWCCVAPWPLFNQGHCCGTKPCTKWSAQKKAGRYGTAFPILKGICDQNHTITVKEIGGARRHKHP